MAAVGAEVASSWFLSSGVLSFFILLLLLSIFLTSLCSDCGRRSFELHKTSMEPSPSSLIKVVKLEDAMMARENPTINEIQNDERDIRHDEENQVPVNSWRSHLVAPELKQDANTEAETSAQFPPWRSHLTGAQNQAASGSSRPDSDHIYQTIGAAPASAASNQQPSSVAAEDLSAPDMNSVYAQVSKKPPKTTATADAPGQVQEEEESSPPLPGRASVEE